MSVRPRLLVALVVGALVLVVAGVAMSAAPASGESAIGRLALDLTILVSAALFGGHLAVRAGQPAVLGELLAGLLVGSLPFQLIHQISIDPYVDILAQLGMLLLLFEVGLELSVADLFAVGASALLVAAAGTTASLTLGTAAAALLLPSFAFRAKLFIGGAIAATSVGITARVLRDMGASRSDEARIILGAAVVDDVLALGLLGILSMWTASGTPDLAAKGLSTAGLVMKTVGFLTLAVVLGAWLTPVWFRRAARLRTRSALLAVGLRFCFVLAWAASAIGLAPLIGAFAAGLVLEDTHSESFVRRGERSLGELLEPMTSFLVPLFFVLVGLRTNLALFVNPGVAALAGALFVAAVFGKLACAVGVLQKGANRLSVALGMMPRGEVTLVFAALGRTLAAGGTALLDERGYAALVAVVILTTLATPPALKWSLVRRGPEQVTRPAA
jgi:Kef-type K+ transport system membrane component KefB